jgi:hypothetical protein
MLVLTGAPWLLDQTPEAALKRLNLHYGHVERSPLKGGRMQLIK